MKLTDSARATTSQSAASRPLALAALFFILGAALTGAWFHYKTSPASANVDGLSEATRNLLGNLETPVAIRFYSLLPAGSRDDLQGYSGRVAGLLAAVQEAGAGKIKVTQLDVPAETNITAATADGIQVFNLDKGEACFLGLSISGGKNQEVLPRLQPEWESALVSDLVRAIVRVATPPPPAPLPAEVAQPSAEIVASIKRLIPEVNAVSVEAADQIFHAEFLKDCAAAGTEMEAQIDAAQKLVVQAQTSGSPDDVAAAQKHVQVVQVEQGEKLKRIAADLQTRLAVFKQMKAGIADPAK